MALFNKYERFLAIVLTKFPKLKLAIKKIYQYINFWLYRKEYMYKSNYPFESFTFGEELETFFGYYDKSPENLSGRFIIFQKTAHNTQYLPDPKIPVYLVLYDLIEKREIQSYKTFTYNWQQGAKPQWIDDYRFIFNDYDSKQNIYYSKVVDARFPDKIMKVNFPVYDVYQNVVLSLNFNRLHLMRPDYGYRNINIKEFPEIDGIFYGELAKNNLDILISLQEICSIEYKPEFSAANHKVNHIMISPNGGKFIFLHRYFIGRQKFDRLLIADINGKNIEVIASDQMISHCCWYGNDRIIAYMRQFSSGDKYYAINIKTKKIEAIGEGIIDKFGDGHPSIKNDIMLFDTYPNKARLKELYTYHLKKRELKKIGEFFESLKYYGETRCDLHPKWNYDGSRIYFDSVHEGTRKLYYLNFKEDE